MGICFNQMLLDFGFLGRLPRESGAIKRYALNS